MSVLLYVRQSSGHTGWTDSDPISNQIVSILERCRDTTKIRILDNSVLITVNHQEQQTVLHLLHKQQHHVYQGLVKDCSVLSPSQLLCLSSAGKLFIVEFVDHGSKTAEVFKGSVDGYHVNHNTKQIVVLSSVFLKKSQIVHVLDFSLNILHSYSLLQQGLQCLLLDSGVCVILTSSGSCILLKQQLQKAIGDGYSKICMQHANNRFMLVDSAGMVTWCTHKGRIQETPVHLTRVPEWIQPIQSGFYCAFCPVDDTTVQIELIIDISRHDVHCQGRPASIQPYTLCRISRNQAALSFHRKDAICIYERGESVSLSVYRIDSDGFERYINLLVEDKLFDTALKLIHRHKAIDSSIDKLESRLLYQLAYCQVYEDKDYENGLLNLSTCCRNDTIRLLNFFEFLLPSSLRDDHSAAPHLSELESQRLSSCVLPYLWSHRSRIVAEKASDENLLMLLDTAIFQCLLHGPDSGALFQFLQRRDVKVDYKTSKILLQQQGRYCELLELYKSQGHHSTAMDLLYKLSTASDTLVPAPVGASSELDGRPGAWAAVKYLSTITDPEPSLVKFHCRWIISLDPDAAVDMFVHLYPSISASLSASILSQDNTVDSYLYATRYLEEIYDSLSAGDREVLGNLYLKIMASGNLSIDTCRDVLNKLQQLLQDNDSFDISKMLSILPPRKRSSDEMLEARVLLLEKQKMDKEALEIMIFDIRDFRRVEEYCSRRGGSKLVYLTLMKVILSDSKNHSGFLRNALDIIGRSSIPDAAMEAFSMVPDWVPIHDTKQFLQSTLWMMIEYQKRLCLTKNLARASLHSMSHRRVSLEEEKKIVHGENMCSICRKRLGASAHVHDGTSLSHYSCYARLARQSS